MGPQIIDSLQDDRPNMSHDQHLDAIVLPASTVDHDELGSFIEPFVANGKLLPRTLDELAELVDTGFIALKDGRIVGFAALEIYSPKLAELRSLAVDPAYQGQGIGSRLVEECLKLARIRRVFEVMAITSSEQFFRQCGFDFTLPGEKKALFHQTRESY
jgi:N-acetylglutamate synthase-like GNAT family acetyltransferase